MNPTFSFSLLADHVASRLDSFPVKASTFGDTNDSMYWYITIICIVFFIPIAACLFGFAWKYNKPKGTPAESQVAHHTGLEIAWSVLPSLVLIWMFYKGAVGYLDQRTVPDGAYEVGVQAQKWNWLFDYGNGTKNPELHLLVDEPTKLIMQSSDVIHSLYVPAFRAKKDIVPGRYNYMWFKPTVANEKVTPEELKKAKAVNKGQPWDLERWQFTEEGYKFYDLYCAEYCGKDHSIMQTIVVVHEKQEDLDAWIKLKSSRGTIPPVEWGKRLYEQRGCKSCHSLDGVRGTGPSYKDSFGTEQKMANGEMVKVDENYVRESILYPKAKVRESYSPAMPSYKGQLSNDDIDSLIAFIKSQSASATRSKEKETTSEPASDE